MDFVNKLYDIANRFINLDRVCSTAAEVSYVLDEYKPQSPDEKEILDKASNDVLAYSFAGACMGFAMALSLRRYIPSKFEDISIKRCILDLGLTTGGYALFSNLGNEIALEKIKRIRKNLVLSNNAGYLRHLDKNNKKFPKAYNSEKQMFLAILKPKEFEEWIHQTNHKDILDNEELS